jgi:dihydrofolate synthase/folylpolyglutamate synthase
MTYQETLDWMFAQLPMYQQKGKSAYNGKLKGIQLFAAHLGDPHLKFKSIHVAGTNGKGSCSHMLASILQEAGYKVGLYTSPHLRDFRERIKINGKMISEDAVIKFISVNKPFIEATKLSFFEMTVAMAFDYFSKQKVDIAVIEVGLGGRLDSTNIIRPAVSLITNIGMDHTDMLGDSLAKIAYEKAGIIKTNTTVVLSEYQEETLPIFKEAALQKNAKVIVAEDEITDMYETSLQGEYQKKNILGVVAVIRELRDFSVSKEHIKNGLQKVEENTGLMGRWQLLGENPRIICDTAHNWEGISLVLEQLKTEEFHTLHMVLGFVKDKNLDPILPLFPKDAKYYFSKADIPRGLDAIELQMKASEFGLYGAVYNSVEGALKKAIEAASENDLIFVGGSTFTVAEVV